MTLIERRSKTDLLIMIGLCCLTLIIMYVLYFYIKPMFTLEFILSAAKSAVTSETPTNATVSLNVTSKAVDVSI